MVERLVVWAVQRYVKGPARSWIYTGAAVVGLRFVRSRLGSQRVVERRPLGPGRGLVVEHLPITHRTQMRRFAAARRAERRTARRASRSG